ncbi:MAG: hypothetical protein ACTSPY_11695 [Candidatus Helarchaeota archaeon]
MDDIILQIAKILKRYSKKTDFKTYFVELCNSILPFRDILQKEHVLKIIDGKIPIDLTGDVQSFELLFKSIRRFKEFNIWPIHILQLSLLISELLKDSEFPTKKIKALLDLFEKLLVF